MLPALCLRSSCVLFNAGLSCVLTADLSSATAHRLKVLLPSWGCCVGPRSIGGPGLPRVRLMSSDLSQGSIGWQPVKCHFALSRSCFNPFSPSFSSGGKRVPRQAAPDPVSGGWDAGVPGAAALSASDSSWGRSSRALQIANTETMLGASLQGSTWFSEGWAEVRASFRVQAGLPAPHPALPAAQFASGSCLAGADAGDV